MNTISKTINSYFQTKANHLNCMKITFKAHINIIEFSLYQTLNDKIYDSLRKTINLFAFGGIATVCKGEKPTDHPYDKWSRPAQMGGYPQRSERHGSQFIA